jgi:uncharacterized membrane protein YkvI
VPILTADHFRRFLLPGFAFKAVVIGGGYATGREIAEFFLPSGAWGGLAAMILATAIWSLVAAATFWFARRTGAQDYRAFFAALLGRGWIAFEVAYILFAVLILAVFGAAAGAIGAAAFGWPPITGTLVLLIAITACVAFGNAGVERLFLWVSVLLYATYAAFFVLALTHFGDRMTTAFATAPAPSGDWVLGGVTYAGYNIIGAVVVLPVTRHFKRDRDAVVAGLVAGPLAMLPALLFFVSMVGFLPEVSDAVLPSDFLLTRLNQPLFHILFQVMILAALLESGSGTVHAINERMAHRLVRPLTPMIRSGAALLLLLPCMLLADRVGLVALIASGYRLLAGVLIVIYVLPLLATVALRRRQIAVPEAI